MHFNSKESDPKGLAQSLDDYLKQDTLFIMYA